MFAKVVVYVKSSNVDITLLIAFLKSIKIILTSEVEYWLILV